ncbi:Lysine-specific demethylase 4A [Fasciola hepatica]|uniref:Lysine-specific demethylase 4A n=1 Tax=Fasciola hepatica TaxID=6192 RepID=A0A4E0RWN5_FASHE|nr:Lysine-specific demethylase 4A [Fasciola hepatica]
MPFREFRSLACSSPYATPTHRDVEHLEKKYWSTINTGRPLYGANVNGTLTTSTTGWNIAQLDSMLSRVLSSENVKIPGVNTPYLYYGMWRATFAWHVEDVDLYSINYVHFGAPKFWYVIPPAYARRFEAFVSEYFRADFVHCNCFLRHKCVLIHPSILEKAGIPTRKIVQNAGEFMINFPYAYHSGFNMGLNVAESTNFALPRWINYGKKAKLCHCWDDTVKICMDPFVRFYQPHLYVDWMKGIDRTPHPLDEYDGLRSTRAAQCTSTPQSKVISKALVPISNSRKSSGDPVLSGPDLNTYLEETAPFEIGDLNNLDVRFVAKSKT